MNGEAFRVYVEQVLLLELLPNDIVIMDNLPAQIRSRWPSPSSRPVCAARRRGQWIALWQSLGDALAQFSAEECRHFFEAAEYGQG